MTAQGAYLLYFQVRAACAVRAVRAACASVCMFFSTVDQLTHWRVPVIPAAEDGSEAQARVEDLPAVFQRAPHSQHLATCTITKVECSSTAG